MCVVFYWMWHMYTDMRGTTPACNNIDWIIQVPRCYAGTTIISILFSQPLWSIQMLNSTKLLILTSRSSCWCGTPSPNLHSSTKQSHIHCNCILVIIMASTPLIVKHANTNWYQTTIASSQLLLMWHPKPKTCAKLLLHVYWNVKP